MEPRWVGMEGRSKMVSCPPLPWQGPSTVPGAPAPSSLALGTARNELPLYPDFFLPLLWYKTTTDLIELN